MRNITLHTRNLLLILMLSVASIANYAQTSAEPTPKPVSISGFFDLYYSQNFNNPLSLTNKYHNFDVTGNQIALSLAEVVIQKPAEPVGFRLDLDFGPTTDLVHSSDVPLKYIQQALVTVVVPVGKGLTINAGKMVTHMGAEVIESQNNVNYTRSILFAYAIPYYHIGASASYPFADNFTATGYLYNSWNSYTGGLDNNKDKTLGLSLAWSPKSDLQIIGNWIGGAEQTTTLNKRHVFEGIINYTASDKVALSVNGDYGFERSATDDLSIWKGIATTGKYTINSSWAVSARAEIFSDLQGFATGTVQDIKEITLTGEYKYADNLLLRLEYRRDFSNVSVFESSTGLLDKLAQNTLVLGSVVSF